MDKAMMARVAEDLVTLSRRYGREKLKIPRDRDQAIDFIRKFGYGKKLTLSIDDPRVTSEAERLVGEHRTVLVLPNTHELIYEFYVSSNDADSSVNAHDDSRASGSQATGRLKLRTSALRAYTMLLALIVIWLFFQWATIDPNHPYGLFLGAINFSKLLQQTAVTGVLAVGMLMVIVSGNIDLSVGAVVGLAGGIAAMTQGWGLVPSLVAAIAIGILIGAFQGALVSYVNIPSFIVTLGGLQAWRGLILKLTKGATIPVELPFFRSLGRGFIDRRIGIGLALLGIAAIVWTNIRRKRARRRHGLKTLSTSSIVIRIVVPSIVIVAFIILMNKAGGLPIPVIFLLGVALAGAFLTANTTFGRYLYAIGGNPDAARLSGINLKRYILAAFCLMGALAGLASLLHTARVGSASPDAGTLMELDAIASCVIGGTSLMGGRGTVFGAVLGALILASLDNGMSLLNVENWAQYVVKGGVLVAAVGFDMFGRRKG